MRFRALNESSDSGDEDGDTGLATREAQEEEAFSMYNSALKTHYQGNLEESQEVLEKIMLLEFISKAQPQEISDVKHGKDEKVPLCPALNLKYLVLKNLAVISYKKQNYKSSVSYYLQSLDIDSSDVNTWYHAGSTALNLPNYSLARLCFEEGLKRNSSHWPSLDHVITVTYALNDYANCLHHISNALEVESSYLKGLALKDQIFKEDPSLKTFCECYFVKCDPSIHYTEYDKEAANKIIQESLQLREKNRSFYKPEVLPNFKLNADIKELTWKSVGESFVDMYEHIATADPYISLSCRIDLSEYHCPDKRDIDPELASGQTHGSSSEVTCSSGGKFKIGVLQIVSSQESSAEKDDDSPNVSGMSLLPSTYLENVPENELRSVDPLIYSDAPLGNRKPPKRKRSLLSEISEFCGKRRSTRVRNPAVKRPQDSVNYQEILQQFLPARLIGDGNYDDQDDCFWPGKCIGDHTYGQTAESIYRDGVKEGIIKDANSLTSHEKKDIEEFISENQDNGGMIDLLYKYVTKLGAKSSFLWPKMLPDVFSAAFIRLRRHITMPNLFCYETEKVFTKEIGFAVLTFSELKVDQWYLSTGHSASSSSSFSPKIPSTNASFQIGPDSIGKNFHADMEFLMQLTVRRDALETDWLEFTIRALWLKAKFHSVEGEVDMAVSCMERLTDVLQKECQPDMKVVVINSYFSNSITLETVQQQLELLQRCQSLEEIQRLYESGEYQSVVDLLVATFGPTRSKPKISSDGGIPERHAQLMLLQDSLWKLENYKDCVKWTEVAFKESIQQYMNASNSSAKSDWIDTMAHLLAGLERCVKMDYTLLNGLEHSKLVRLTQNLILVICLQMDSYDISVDSPLAVLPWIVLYRLIQSDEFLEKNAREDSQKTQTVNEHNAQAAGRTAKVADADCSMPSSLLMLITAHECLGRRSCCCASDGLFLSHCVDVFMQKLYDNLNKTQSYREDLEMATEQAFYCLYGHPHKRNKAKHLQEHNSQQLQLTWKRAVQIYQYFTPNVLPEFDSYRTSTVSTELENLLKRITLLVPPELDPSSRVDAYSAYIEGGTDKCPTFPADISQPHIVTQDLYYLLGDYYFKNKEFSKAIRYYLMDVCINPDRLDSWAGMALSRSSQLDQKLNSYEVRNESAIWRKSSAALRCFEHALQLNASTNSLWIEYGSLAYVLHSHASRQLRLNTYFDGPRELLKVKKEEMLLLAERCFKEANKSVGNAEPEEAWLHHYMLGKIAQKFGKSPGIFLEHYQKSLRYLHEDRARYPHKIQYHNPPELSIEVLEVFYRIHASCLKYLSKYESKGMPLKDLKEFQDCLSEVAAGPFSTFQEKISMNSCSPALSECESENLANLHSEESYVKTSTTDHNYFNVHHVKTEEDSPSHNKEVRESKNDGTSVQPEPDIHLAVQEVVECLTSQASGSWLVNFPVKGNGDESNTELKDGTVNVDGIVNMPHPTTSATVPVETVTCPDNPFIVDLTPSSKPNTSTSQEILSSGSTLVNATPEMPEEIGKDIARNVIQSGKQTNPVSSCNTCNLSDSGEQNEVAQVLNKIITSAVQSNIKITCITKVPRTKQDVSVNEENASEFHPTDPIKSEVPNNEAGAALPNNSEKEKTHSTHQSEYEKDELSPNASKQDVQIEVFSEVERGSSVNAIDVSEKELEESKVKIDKLILDCLNGLRECLKRFIQHYKSLYRIADYYCNSVDNKNFQWSREVLLAATPAVKNYPAMPGLFAERKNTNLFNGIWRAPSNEIDRPGSFGAHMYRSVRLLIEVLTKQNDYNMLLYLTQQLYRNPDLGKKYMRDVERISLARQSYDSCVTILRDQMNSLLQEEPPPEESRLTCCLLEIYRTFQTLLKGGIYVDDTNELLEEAYTMYKLGEVDQYPTVLDQAIMFCQLQLGKSYQVAHENSRFGSLSKTVINEMGGDGSSKICSTSTSLYTPDAWQREFAKSLVSAKSSLETRVVPEAHILQESVILIPVDKEVTSIIKHTSVPSTSTLPSQLVHVEKPRAENLQACSVAFLPVTSVLPANNKISTSLSNNTSLLSCQAYECYDILETLMQASGYRVLPQASATNVVNPFTAAPKTITKLNELQTVPKLTVLGSTRERKRAWREWANKPSRQMANQPSSDGVENK